MSKNTRNRILLTALAALLLVTLTIGGTMAWLVDTTNEVKNTFTAAGIDIDLKETMKPDGTVVEDGITEWSAQLIPGNTYKKNPTVSVIRSTYDENGTLLTQGTDVDIWLYVKFENNATSALTYESTLTAANEWIQGNGTDIPTNVWYREVKATDTTISWNLLANDQVSIAEGKTKDDVKTGFTMTWTAYAIQSANRTAAEGWATLNP